VTKKVLVVGARKGSLGEEVAMYAALAAYDVVTAGIAGEERTLSLGSSVLSLAAFLEKEQPTHVVCTVGINNPEQDLDPDALQEWYRWHFGVNVVMPMKLLQAWTMVLANNDTERVPHHYVAISSNSAHVPRSGSAAYCASKAALSMALRVKARELSGAGSNLFVYGYEPGLLADTPMTADTVAQFGPGRLTRMRDQRLAGGMAKSSLASLIVHNLGSGPEVNGCMFRLDADES
jgi:NAD(P)-dependent dehydrogenase (short-subunit alcohol dehydrogenase family)